MTPTTHPPKRPPDPRPPTKPPLAAHGACPAFGDSRLPERFWRHVTVDANGCWIWNAYRNPKGYGFCYLKALAPERRAHRQTYTHLVEPLTPGLEIDHLCRVKPCCNPAHLEEVPGAVNIARHLAHVADRDATTPRAAANTTRAGSGGRAGHHHQP